MKTAASNRVMIFDTTLRDGEQAPGCSMTLQEKLRVAAALRDLRVDVIEAGFPAASPGDFESVQAIASEITGANHLRPRALPSRTTSNAPGRLCNRPQRPAHPRLRGDQRDSPDLQAEHGEGGNHPPRRGVRAPCAQPVHRRGVFGRGCLAHRARLSGGSCRRRSSRPAPRP